MNRTISLSRKELQAAALIFFIHLIGKWESLASLRYGIDDYILSQEGAGGALARSIFLSQGRPAQWIWHRALLFFGADPLASTALMGIISMIGLSLASIYILRVWLASAGEDSDAWLAENFWFGTVVAFLIHGHPYYSDALLYRHSAATQGMTALLSSLGLWLALDGARRFWIGVALMVSALMTGPIAANGLLAALAGAFFFAALRGKSWQTPRRSLLASGAGVLIYLASCSALFRAMDITPEGRWGFLRASELGTRWGQATETWRETLVGPSPIPALPWLLGAAVALCTAGVFHRNSSTDFPKKLWGIAFLLAAMTAWMGTSIVGTSWSINLRTLCAVSTLYAMVVMGAGLDRKRAAIVIGGMMALGFTGESNRLFARQARINVAERTLSIQILAAFNRLPGVEGIHRIAFDGSPNVTHPAMGDRRTETNAPIWNFYLHPRDLVLMEVAFTQLERPTSEDWRRVGEVCAQSPHWPHPASVRVEGELGIVCF